MSGPDEPTHVIYRSDPPPPNPREAQPLPRRRRRFRWVRWLVAVIAVVLVALLVVAALAWLRVDKVTAFSSGDRPAAAAGTNYLMVGSDGREQLTPQQRRELHTGRAEGQRTDTILLLHVPDNGGPSVLVSLPRDSYVPIPGHGRNKLNAAFAFGGAPLLVTTVENVTGLRIDHYVQIGFLGFVDMVDAVGGVQVCPKRAMNDTKAGLHIQAGCQTVTGPTALAYVRARYSDPRGDLGRVERQREVLGAISDKATSPTTLLLPWRLGSLALAAGDSLTVDDASGPLDVARWALAMRAVAGSSGVRTTVPVADPDYHTPVGSTVKWDRQAALRLFDDLKHDRTPASGS
ncbi:MAG: LCP family protein [Actinomycetales bacterium]